jgi:RNA recognition motif-containing protein
VLEANKVFVGGLNYATTEDELKKEFERFGSIINVRVVRNHETGQSRGFAFITFANDIAATEAVAAMDQQQFGGRVIGVKIAYKRS